MKNNPPKVTVHEVYSHVIDVTVESLRRYLEKNKLNSDQIDISSELKLRWQARMDCLSHFLNDSWLKFQENCTKLQGLKKKKYP